MSMWSVPEAERPAGSPVTTGTTTVPTTTLGHVRIPRPSGTVSTTSSFTTCEGSGINGPLVARCKVIITAWAPDGHLQVVVTLVLEEVAMQRRSKKTSPSDQLQETTRETMPHSVVLSTLQLPKEFHPVAKSDRMFLEDKNS